MDPTQCNLCPRRCGSNRTVGVGRCGGDDSIRIARAALHFGEEPCISGKKGSGAVFFSGCTLHCRFCQNAVISNGDVGGEVSPERLSEMFLELQEQGAHNINLVTPSHYAPWIAESLRVVKPYLKIPVICNCGGYESMEILREFDGLIDVYLPDLKYYSALRSERYSGAPDYFETASVALQEMYRQVGACVFDADGMLRKGLLIRHLVLPEGKEDSKILLRWIAETFPSDSVRISLMRQYTPCGDLSACPELNRTLFSLEYSSVLNFARDLHLIGYSQGKGCNDHTMIPEFDLTGVLKKGT